MSRQHISVMTAIVAVVLTWLIAVSAVEREKTRVTLKAQTDAERIAQTFENRTRTIIGYADNYLRAARREYVRDFRTDSVADIIRDIPAVDRFPKNPGVKPLFGQRLVEREKAS